MTAKTQYFTQDQIINELKQYVSGFRTKGEAADALGINRVYLWRILEKQVPPSDAVIKQIGYKIADKITTYTYARL